MPDREKAISALEKALAASETVDSGFIWITVGEGRKALELLKEQETVVRCKDCRYLNEDSGICVIGIMHGYRDTWFCAYGKKKPIEPYVTGNRANFESATSWWYACGNCNKPIDPNDKYCRHCGRGVKWDDRAGEDT